MPPAPVLRKPLQLSARKVLDIVCCLPPPPGTGALGTARRNGRRFGHFIKTSHSEIQGKKGDQGKMEASRAWGRALSSRGVVALPDIAGRHQFSPARRVERRRRRSFSAEKESAYGAR